jgi:DNA-binding response OmpR family regulator
MKKILIVEGLCQWNAHLEELLTDEGYQVLTTRALMSVRQLVVDEQPDLVLIGLGVRPPYGWHLFRQLKNFDVDLPVLVYQATHERAVYDIQQAVRVALREVQSKNSAQRYAVRHWLRPMQAVV